MSRQNYYARRRARQQRGVEADLVVWLVQQERAVQPRLGGRKLLVVLRAELAQAGVNLGRDEFFRILRTRGLLLERRPAAFPHTTQYRAYLPVFTNLVRGVVEDGPHQVWVCDITYVRTAEGFLYVALITDRWSRKIVGWSCGDTLETEGCLRALTLALAQLPTGARPLHHSDRGCQYCSHAYVGRLQARALGISMTEADHCAENALAERVNGILKGEYLLDLEQPSKAAGRAAVAQAITLYNTRRPHTALQYRTPAAVHAQEGAAQD
jgi:transposase InsO family protein